ERVGQCLVHLVCIFSALLIENYNLQNAGKNNDNLIPFLKHLFLFSSGIVSESFLLLMESARLYKTNFVTLHMLCYVFRDDRYTNCEHATKPDESDNLGYFVLVVQLKQLLF